MFADRIKQQADFVSFLKDVEGLVNEHSSGDIEILISNGRLQSAEINVVA